LSRNAIGTIISINAGGASGQVRLPGKTNTQLMPFTGRGNVGDIVPVGFIHGDPQQPIAITQPLRRRRMPSSVLYSPVWAHLYCSKENNPYVILSPVPTFATGQSAEEIDYWPSRLCDMPPYYEGSVEGDRTGNFGGQEYNPGGIQAGCRVVKKTRGGTVTELAIWSTGYIVYCYDLTNSTLLWSHEITGFENHGELGEDESVACECNGAPVTAFVCTENYVVVLVTRLAYTCFPGFVYDCDPGGTGMTVETEFSPWEQYDSVRSYLYLIDYNGNAADTIDLCTEFLGDWGRPAGVSALSAYDYVLAVGGTSPPAGFEQWADFWAWWDPYDPECAAWAQNNFTAGVSTIDDEGYGTTFPTEWAQYMVPTILGDEDEGDVDPENWQGAGLYWEVVVSVKTEEDPDPDHNLVDTFSTRSAWSPLVTQSEGGTEFVYVCRCGYEENPWEKLVPQQAPTYNAEIQPVNTVYKTNLTSKTIACTYTGAESNSARWGNLAAASAVRLWDYNDEGGYGLFVASNSTGFRVVCANDTAILAEETYDYTGYELLSVFTLDGRYFAWGLQHDGSKWALNVWEIGNDCQIWAAWKYNYDREDAAFLASWQSISGSATRQHLAYTKGSNWGQILFDPSGDGTLTSVYYAVLGETVTASYTDGTYIYLLTDAGQLKRYYCTDGSTNSENEQTLDLSNQWVMGSTAFYQVSESGTDNQVITKLI